MTLKYIKSLKLGLAIGVLVLVVACDQEKEPMPELTAPQTIEKPDTCEACDELMRYLGSVKSSLPEDHAFRVAVEENFKPLDLDLIAFELHKPVACEDDLKPKIEPWFTNLEQHAEAIAAKRQSCGDSCPKYNCGEYVDFVGMNAELIVLLALLEERMMDSALASIELPSFKPGDLPTFLANSTASLVQAGALVGQMAGKIQQAEEVPFKKKLIDQALMFKDMAQTTIAISWVAPESQGGLSMAERFSGLSRMLTELAYHYERYFRVKDGGKATMAMQSRLGQLSLSFMSANYELLGALEKHDIDSMNSAGGFSEKEMACHEQLAVNLGVTRELYAIAAETVGECALKQSCKTNLALPYDAIASEQLATSKLISKLDDAQDIAGKVIYSYTNATCQ